MMLNIRFIGPPEPDAPFFYTMGPGFIQVSVDVKDGTNPLLT